VNLDSTVNWDLSLNIRKLVSLVHSQMLKARALVIHAQLATTALELFQSLLPAILELSHPSDL
jgi:hypothetical protein